MATIRYPVICPGCNSTIILRIGVGFSESPHFFFVCGRCSAASRAVHHVYSKNVSTRLELEEAEFGKESDADQEILLHPDFPAYAGQDTASQQLTAFMYIISILGHRCFDDTMFRVNSFRGGIAQNWSGVRRWMTYYLNENWEMFDLEYRRFYEEKCPDSPSMLQRHDILHRSLDILTCPLWVTDVYPDLKSAWVNYLQKSQSWEDNLISFACNRKNAVIDLQTDVFNCIVRFVELEAEMLPAFAAEVLEAGGSDVAHLRLYVDAFPQLRDFYISSFEAVCNSLVYAIAIYNLYVSGDVNKFEGSEPSSLKKFEKLTNNQKEKIVSAIPPFDRLWNEILDRDIRNAIGHHGIRHNLSTGMLDFRNKQPVPYLTFVTRCIRVNQALLWAANVLKYMRILADSPENARHG